MEFTFFVEKCVLAFLTGKCIFCGFEGKYFLAGKHIVLVSEENRIFGFGGKTYFAVLTGKHAFWLWRKTAFLRFWRKTYFCGFGGKIRFDGFGEKMCVWQGKRIFAGLMRKHGGKTRF